jgi:hypothetical protein
MFAAHARAEEPRDYDPTVPEWMRTFYYGDLGGPEYRGPWVYGIDRLGTDKEVDEGFIPGSTWKYTYRSRGAGHKVDFWNNASDMQVAGLSFSNDISAWLDPPEGMTRSIRYSILQDYSGGGGPNNSDIVEIDENQVETLMKHGYKNGPPPVPPYDTLGQDDPWGVTDVGISAFDYKADLAPDRGWYNHYDAISDSSGGPRPDDFYDARPQWSWYQSGEDMYFAAGKTGQFDDTTHMLMYGKRVREYWGESNGSGYGKLGQARFDTRGTMSGEDFWRWSYYSDGRWWNYVVIDDTTYWLYMENSDGSIRDYDADIYPEDPAHQGEPEYASGHPIVWHDDYELELTYGLDLDTDPDTHGEAGRYVIERSATTYWEDLQAYTHAGDVMSETRTYNPIMNDGSDGPESQYEWLYDASGDMYVPAGTPPAGGWSDDPYDRALELVGHHPAYPGDDTPEECEFPDDNFLGLNIDKGIVSQQYFVHAWKIAGKLLGDRFWEDGYVWSNELGAVASRALVEDDFVQTMPTYMLRMPVMTWNSDDGRWEFPTSSSSTSYPLLWSFQDHYADTAVAGHDEINNFLRYVMDIDALVIQDVNGDGVYDEEEDYILFSLVDDGRFTKMPYWGLYGYDPVDVKDTPFADEYFSGETIFLYHNCEVTTYFDPATGIFFGESIGTTGGYTLWGTPNDIYDLNALDIGLVPEPTTTILIIGAGLALGAGIMRRRLFK